VQVAKGGIVSRASSAETGVCYLGVFLGSETGLRSSGKE
jgi:hypothetical protein